MSEHLPKQLANHHPVAEFLPSDKSVASLLANGKNESPAQIYVKRHTSPESQRVARVKAESVAYMLGYDNPDYIRWDRVNYTDAINMRSALMRAKTAHGNTLSPATVNHTIIAFRQMAKIAWLMGIIDHEQHSVLKSIEQMPGTREKIRDLPMPSDVEALIDSCFEDPTSAGARDAAIITLAFGAGLRRSEITNIIYPDHLIYSQSALQVIGKGNKQRLMPLAPYMIDIIDTWVKDVRGEQRGPLFHRIRKNGDIQSEKLTPQAIRFILEQRCLKAGVKIIRPHDARSAYGTNLLNNGTDIITVRNLLGHSSVTTTERYMQVKQNDMAKAVNNNLNILSSAIFKRDVK
jgi:site-specific recombinase XerD